MNEKLFVAGHPGSTDRLTTYDALRLMRDEGMPRLMDYIRRREISLQQYSGRSPEHARRADDQLHGVQNIRKRYTGHIAAIQTPAFMEQLREREVRIKKLVAKNPKLQKVVGTAWEDIRKALEFFGNNRNEYHLFEGGRGFRSQYFSIARTIVRLLEEDAKPNAKRLEEYAEARRESLLEELFSSTPIYKDLEEHVFADALRYLAETIGFEDPAVVAVLKGKSVEEVAHDYITRTKLDSVAERKKLVRSGSKDLLKSKDPFIQLALLIDGRARKVRKLVETNVDTVTEDAYGRIVNALFTLYGESLYPDATFTLRLTYGKLVSFAYQKVPEQQYTTIGGVFAHGALHNHSGPWKLPPTWEKQKAKLIADRSAFNFITTHDTHGGNSGSPVFTKDFEVVGLLFDGVMHSQGGGLDLYMSDVPEHTVCVHAQGIHSVLKKVYHADALVRELEGKP